MAVRSVYFLLWRFKSSIDPLLIRAIGEICGPKAMPVGISNQGSILQKIALFPVARGTISKRWQAFSSGRNVMARAALTAVMHHLRRLAEGNGAAEQDDRVLLERFVRQRDEWAFSLLVRRHGSLVLRVCRGVLRNDHDAEDAFQATFLVLARKAGTIRKGGSLASWLFGVARRTALKEAGRPPASATAAACARTKPGTAIVCSLVARVTSDPRS